MNKAQYARKACKNNNMGNEKPCFGYIQRKISKEWVEKMHKVSGINLINDIGKVVPHLPFYFIFFFVLSRRIIFGLQRVRKKWLKQIVKRRDSKSP